MASQTINIPMGDQVPVTSLVVKDAAGNDITSQSTLTMDTDNHAVAIVGTAFGQTNVRSVGPGTCHVTYTATNSSGTVQQVDTVNVIEAAPASIIATYGTPVANN